MRRTDKEITDREQLEAIIRNDLVCRLALARGNVPYVVRMSSPTADVWDGSGPVENGDQNQASICQRFSRRATLCP